MTTLQSLAKSIKSRIQPAFLQKVIQQKKKISLFVVGGTTGFLGCWGLAFMFLMPETMSKILINLGAFSLMVGVIAFLFPYCDTKRLEKSIINLHDSQSISCLATYDFLGTFDQKLTQEEMQELLGVEISDDTLNILNEAISNSGTVYYDDVVKMLNQSNSEKYAIKNHANFIENGNYNNTKQQKNLERLAQLNTSKLQQNYKTFNSRATL